MSTKSTTQIVVVTDQAFQNAALRFLAQLPVATVLTRVAQQELMARLARVDAIFMDADGTIVEEGHTVLGADYVECIAALAQAGVSATMVTGKPLQEIRRLIDTLPAGLPLNIIYEKGAYYLEPDEHGVLQKRYLLSTAELEASVRELRALFAREKSAIEQKYLTDDGKPRVVLGWAGSGTHESVLSIDILQGDAPVNYLDLVGAEREALKLKDPELLAQVEADLQMFTDLHRPGWQLVHLGNGNSEIAPGPIEKDRAIKASPMYANAHGVLVLGDSGNDRKMFGLRNPQILAGLVLHREKSLELVDDVDMVSFGMANARPMLDLVLTAKAQ